MLSAKLKYKNDSTWYNVDNYIINTLNIPFVQRDLSYNLDSAGLDVEFTIKYNFENKTANDIEKIKFIDGSNYFIGVPVSIVDNKDNDRTSVTFLKEIHLLKSKKINRTNLSSRLANTTNKRLYNNQDANGNNSTSLMWLIKNMFEHVGLVDPTISLAPKIAITQKTSYTNILFSELKVDMDITYCINQQVAVKSDSSISTLFNPESEITYFDFVDKFCQLFGVKLSNNDNGYYFDIADEYLYSISDDYTFSYKSTYYEKEGDVQEFGFAFFNDRYNYTINTESNLNSGWYSNTKNEITSNWYDNLIFGYENRSLNGSVNEGSIYELNSFIDYITANDPTYYETKIGNKIRNRSEKNYTKEFITTRTPSLFTLANILKGVGNYSQNSMELQIEQITIHN